MRLQQPIMSGTCVPYTEYLGNNNTRDSKTPSFRSPADKNFTENQGSIFECAEPFVVAKSRHYGHLKGENEGIYLFYCLQPTGRRDATVCARVSVEALLPCKGGTRFDCPVFVKWRPLERAHPFLSLPFLSNAAACTGVSVCRMDAMTRRMRFSTIRYSC